MNYFTKEWYMTMQKTDLHFGLEKSRKAGKFSEEYFRKLYKKKLTEFIRFERRMAKESMYASDLEGLESFDEDEQEAIQRNGEDIVLKPLLISADHTIDLLEGVHEEALKEPVVFDVEKHEEIFEEVFQERLKGYKENLSGKIKEQIADLRVFTLGKVTGKVLKKVRKLSSKNNRKVERAAKGYQKYLKKAKSVRKLYKDGFDLHDCRITEVIRENGMLIIGLDNRGGFTDVERLVLLDPEVTLMENELSGLYWLYEEVYRNDDRYELNVLLARQDGIKSYFSVIYDKLLMVHGEKDWGDFE